MDYYLNTHYYNYYLIHESRLKVLLTHFSLGYYFKRLFVNIAPVVKRIEPRQTCR